MPLRRDPARREIEDAVGRLLGAAFDLDEPTLLRIRHEWGLIEPWRRTQAWRHVRTALKATHRDALMDDARNAVMQWVNSASHLIPAVDAVAAAARYEQLGPRAQAAPAVLDAAAQVIIGDQLDPEDRHVLAHPFATRPGKPSAPPTEQDEVEADRRRFWG
jgi:hypothetical protein